ncbi:hypothetical protein E2562_006691 [Oryza meyeriana var. granulata]|uniref:Uncharacterized protein n=1 Tax=Oryza meyeriana var. granulata TaxID=110450 RepID=A0A6G1EFX7_9ORYZ|nr:hypothetical protein E2562_006691 [Oryza meyeriana var. granulata]
MARRTRERRRAGEVASSEPESGTVSMPRVRSSSSPWASLHGDLVDLIASRVLAGDLLDYVRFRAVCVPWRSATVCPRGRGVDDPRFHPGNRKLRGYVRFINLDTGAFVRAHLPLFRDTPSTASSSSCSATTTPPSASSIPSPATSSTSHCSPPSSPSWAASHGHRTRVAPMMRWVCASIPSLPPAAQEESSQS